MSGMKSEARPVAASVFVSMTWSHPFGSIRGRLVLVMLLAIVPLAVLIVYDAAGNREVALGEARAQLESLVRLAADDLETRVTGARHVLHGLSAANAVRSASEPACSSLLAGILKEADRYNNIFVADADGNLLCGALPTAGPVNYGDAEYFRRVLASRVPVVGKPTIGRITGRAVVTLAWPLLDPYGRVDKVLVGGLKLAWFGQRFAGKDLLPGMVALIWDEEGRVLHREPDDGKLIGTLHPDAPLISAARRAKGSGVLEAPGLDGVRRIYALTDFPGLSELGLTLAFGVPTAEFAAAADHDLRRNLLVLALVAAVVFALAIWLSEVTVRRPVARLARASARLRGGDLKVRLPGPYPSGEIGTLLTQFNETAAALEAQTEHLRRSNRALRTLSECNQTLVRATSEAQLLQAICERIVRFGGYRFAWIGYAEDDAEKSVRPVARAGFEQGYLDGLRITWADEERGRGLTGAAIRSGEPFVAPDIASDVRLAPWHEAALQRGYASSIALPLLVEGRSIGALNIYAAERDAFDEEELPLLKELAADLAYGIAALRARDERERTVAALRRSEERFRGTLDNMMEGCQIIGFDWRYRYLNAAAAAQNRAPAATLLGRTMMEAFPGIEATPLFIVLQRCMASRVTELMENEFSFPDGTRGWFELVIQPAPEGVFVLSLDITARKHADAEIRSLNADLERRVAERTGQLEAANRELESFSYSVSHDLRAPLRAVDGYARMLEEDYAPRLDGEARRLLGVVRGEAKRMGQLIDDLLAFSRTGRQRIDAVPVDMALLAREAAAEASRDYPGTPLQIGELPVASGDRALLKQVWANLIGNALKYSSKVAAPRIEIGGRANGAEHQYWVRDNGAGFDSRYADRLFGVFRRLHVDEDFPGSGVGLAIVRRIVVRHGGRVWAEGKAGAGACFGFALPTAR